MNTSLKARPIRTTVCLPFLFVLAFTTQLLGYTKNGTTFSTNGSVSDVNSAINAAAAGDTVNIPAGTYTWGTAGAYVSVNKAITLAGAGQDATILIQSPETDGDGINGGGLMVISAAATVKGFSVNQVPNKKVFTIAWGTPDGWRVTDVGVHGTYGRIFMISSSYGLVDNCNIGWETESIFIIGKSDAWSSPHTMGTADAVYFENNTFYNSGANQGYIDGNIDAKFVARFNTLIGNAKFDSHGYWSNGGNSARQIEVYHNTWPAIGLRASPSNLYAVEIRGGTGIVFNNKAADDTFGGRGGIIKLQEYDTIATYPLPQMVGTGNRGAGTEPVYTWGNRRGAAANYGNGMLLDVPQPTFIMPDRDFFAEPQHGISGGFTVPDPFTGATGVGAKTKSQMLTIVPTTVGIGCWVTDEGSWDSTKAANTSGRLYRWNGSAWEQYYMPLSYPHPLRSSESKVRKPCPSLAPGSFGGTQYVLLASNSNGASIRYTTDGSAPSTSNGILYTGEIAITSTTILKAIAYDGALQNSDVFTGTYSIQGIASTPTVTPAAGTYATNTAPFLVTLSSLTAGATIYYTTDGSTPTTTSKIYTWPITISGTVTIKAYSVAPGTYDSSILSATYNISDTVPSPTASPIGGTYISNQTVNLSCATAGASIYYTTNDTIPTPNSTLYTGPIAVATSQTIRAIAIKPGMTTSNVLVATYTISADVGNTVLFRNLAPYQGRMVHARFTAPLTGTFVKAAFYGTNSNTNNSVKLTLYEDINGNGSNLVRVGGTIEYTNIGVMAEKRWHDFDTSFEIVSGHQYQIGMDFSDNASVQMDYTVWSEPNGYSIGGNYSEAWASNITSASVNALHYAIKGSVSPTGTVAAPVASPAAGAYSVAQMITLSTATAGADIRYTLDGAIPTVNSPLYTGPISVTATQTVKAVGIKAGSASSAVFSGTYSIGPKQQAPQNPNITISVEPPK